MDEKQKYNLILKKIGNTSIVLQILFNYFTS